MIETSDAGESVPRTGIGLPPQVASYMGITTNRLARLRSEGQGPAWLKIGKSVRYRWLDVHKFVEQNLRATTSGVVQDELDVLAHGDSGEAS